MTAVIYARYSSDSQREESIEGQIRECTAFAEKNGITILRHYIDRAFSAKTDNRPEFQAMVKDSGKKLFDMVIVWKLDRFARNRYDSARYKTLLKKNGVKVVSATGVISNGAEGIILESVLEGYAEYFSADLSEKVIRGRTENALKCKFNGGTLPIGYVIDSEHHFQIDPLTAPYVLEVFKRYDEGATMTDIRDWLNEKGMKNTRGQPFTYNSVQHLLNSRRYMGEFRYRDTVIPDGIPTIVPKDLFDRVQEKLAKNKKAPARHKAEDDYLLTTKLFCGYCGSYMCGESGTSHTGKVHHYYKCATVKKKRGDCHKKPVNKQFIEDFVVHETMRTALKTKGTGKTGPCSSVRAVLPFSHRKLCAGLRWEPWGMSFIHQASDLDQLVPQLGNALHDPLRHPGQPCPVIPATRHETGAAGKSCPPPPDEPQKQQQYRRGHAQRPHRSNRDARVSRPAWPSAVRPEVFA